MARKRKEASPPPGSPAWMATFSDLMNLLLCFFILLFASSTIDAEKLEQIAASFTKQNYSILPEAATSIGDGKLISGGMTQMTILDNYVNKLGKSKEGNENVSTAENDATTQSEQKTTEQATTQDLNEQIKDTGLKQSEKMADEIQKMADNYRISDQIDVDYDAQMVRISLSGGILFESGQAELTKSAEKLVNKVGDILEQYRKRTIEIEGHTDNVPSHSARYPNNQYLSSARAITVYEYLLENKNLIAKNVKHSGYGENRPRVSNKTAKGRAKNRRVEIKIYNQINSDN